MKTLSCILMAGVMSVMSGCHTSHEVKTDSVVEIKPIKIEPIYARIDIYIKIDKELDSFFDFEESVKPKPAEPAATETPATQKEGA